MLESAFAAATIVFVVITLMQCWHRPGWWDRGFDFPRLQLAVLIGALLVAEILLLNWRHPGHLLLMVAGAACLGYQLWWILPYTRLWPLSVGWAEGHGRPRITVMAANVLTPNRCARRLLDLIRQHRPDVLVLLETDRWWQEQMAEIEPDYPYSMRCPLDNLYGMHVFSRLPLEDTELCFLVQQDVPSMHALVRVNDDLAIRMHFLHPAPPSPTENQRSTERDVELLVVARSVRQDNRPIIVAGDLNDVAWSPTTRLFRKISNLLDPRIGRGMYNSYHAQHWFLRWPLDHFFHSAHFKVARIVRLPAFGSDHFPLLIELEFCDGYDDEQESLERDAADRKRASRKIAKKDVDSSDVPVPGR